MIEKRINTKFGVATINKTDGYYKITSRKEGNQGKLLHRLIYEDYHDITLPDSIHIHHIDKDKTNNDIDNLMPISHSEHASLHHKGKILSDKTKQKLRDIHLGMKCTEDCKLKMSKKHSTTGYYRVTKQVDKKSSQGFVWRYQYYENGKRKAISRVSFKELKKAVLAKGLRWEKLGDENEPIPV